MFRLNKKYACYAFLLFVIEVIIALFVKDQFVRPFLGDVLVTMLLYFLVKAFFHLKAVNVAVGVLLFAYLIELTQYFDLAEKLALRKGSILHVILGSTFDWMDLLAYTLGIFIVLLIDIKLKR